MAEYNVEAADLSQAAEKEIEFENITKGDKIQIFYKDGDQLKDGLGNKVFKAASDPYKKDGKWKIKLEPVAEK